jgi:protein SCO1/2
MTRKRLLIAVTLACGVLLALALYLPGLRPEPMVSREVSGRADIGGPFTLTDQRGEIVTSDSLKGRYALIFFGFTNCPDVCPLTLQVITQALEIAGPLGDNVVPVFITVDPARDTPEVMAAYIANFHPRFLALTGSAEAVKQAADGYRVFFRRAAAAEGADAATYMMEHSGFSYFMGKDGALIAFFGPKTTAEDMAARIRRETSPTR